MKEPDVEYPSKPGNRENVGAVAGASVQEADLVEPSDRDPAFDPDGAAIRAVLAGDSAHYGEVVERHQGSLLRLVTGLVGDPDVADDVTQEVWLIAYRKLESFQFRSKFRTWLHRIAVREALSTKTRIRRLWSRTRPLVEVTPPAAPATNPRPADDSEPVRKALARVPPAERVAFLLHAEGFRYDEIAESLGCPEGTVATRIHRARAKLKSMLDAPRAPAASRSPMRIVAETKNLTSRDVRVRQDVPEARDVRMKP